MECIIEWDRTDTRNQNRATVTNDDFIEYVELSYLIISEYKMIWVLVINVFDKYTRVQMILSNLFAIHF